MKFFRRWFGRDRSADKPDTEAAVDDEIAEAGDAVSESSLSDSASGNEDDEVGELPEIEQYCTKRQHRHSVSAEAYGEWNKKTDFVPPVHPKSEAQRERIELAIAKGFMFNCLETNDLKSVIDAFTERKVPSNETIITQGEDGDSLYLIEEGDFDVFKRLSGEEEAKHMCVMTVGDTVGELALLYNCPRAATVTAKTDCIVWALDRQSFNCIVRDAAARKREMHEAFLAEVDLLKDMDPYERSKLADALKTTSFSAGTQVIKEGEPGDSFYIIESGEADAFKDDQLVLQYTRGMYFGELALIKDQPRAATIVARTDLKCVSLDRRSFKRLLGPVDAILRRNAERYKMVKAKLGSKEAKENGKQMEVEKNENEKII